MITFTCDNCGQLVFFDNLACTRCGSELGLDLPASRIQVLSATASRCANRANGCNWLVAYDDAFCTSCRLTGTRPSEEDPDITDAWAAAEAAKRRLVFQMTRVGLDISGVTFDLLSSRNEPVTTGHADGVITLDLAEADDVKRARMQAQMDEPYRTLLGHFRHEIGHFIWGSMIDDTSQIDSWRQRFGDERADYAEALEEHYDSPPPDGWRNSFVSTYATAHPWEDFAETFAHYLHITDVLETSGSFGISVDGAHAVLTADPDDVEPTQDDFGWIIRQWLPLTYALNAVNRSMGSPDLYPFVLAPTVISKLTWVHDLVRGASPTEAPAPPAAR